MVSVAPMRSLTAAVLLASGLLLASAAARAAGAEPPRRVVSMNPSLTEILLALDAGHLLVGVDDYSARQQQRLASLPRVGGLFDPNLESVVALEPDLVVLVPSVEQRDFRERLGELGIPRLELDPTSFDEVLETIEVLGQRLGRADAAEVRVRAIRRARGEVRARTAALPRRRVVLVLQREPLFVVGRGSFLHEMLEAVGATNLGSALDATYPRVDLEWLVAARPDRVLDASRDAAGADDTWGRLPSLSGRVVALGEGVATRPGPWLDRALWALARAVHGAALDGEPR